MVPNLLISDTIEMCMPELHAAVINKRRQDIYKLIDKRADITELYKGKTPLDVIFDGASDERDRALWLQHRLWKKIGGHITSNKAHETPTGGKVNHKSKQVSEKEIREDVEQLQAWKNAVHRISRKKLIEFPDFLTTELDSGVMFIKESPSDINKLYYEHYFGKN